MKTVDVLDVKVLPNYTGSMVQGSPFIGVVLTMGKKSILFVDDEQKILSGLKRSLHKKKAVWDMYFASGGEEALETMARREFDVVVTDIRMPRMDGVRLLGEVKRLHPKTVRMVLSGCAETEKENKAVLVAHQYLSKPLDPQKLEKAITRACNVQDRLKNNELKEIISHIGTLPSLPQVYLEMIDALAGEASINEIAGIVTKDIAMSTKVLQIVNSAFFGFIRQISEIREAVVYLGVDTIQSLTLSIHAFEEFKSKKAIRGFSPDSLRDHCLTVGNVSKKIAEQQDRKRKEQDTARTSGMLHDLGKLIMFSRKPDIFERALRVAEQEQRSLLDVENDMMGANHADLGAYLLDLWNLPYEIVGAVIRHHEPPQDRLDDDGIAGIVYVANAYVHIKENGLEKTKKRYQINSPFFKDTSFLEDR